MTTRHRWAAFAAAALFVLPLGLSGQSADVDITPDVVYGHKMGMALTFDVIQPTGDRNGAAVIYMVSGGWFSTWSPPERMAQRFAELLERGFAVIPVRHGSSPRFDVPEAHADVDRALRYIHLHAADWGVDPDRLGVFGGSAGGHLALMLGLAPDHGGPISSGQRVRDPDAPATAIEGDDAVMQASDRVAAVVAYYPPVDLRRMAGPSERFPALDFDPALAPDISPILFVTSDDPPTLLVHGDADELVNIRNSQIMYQALQDAGVESQFVTIPGGTHGFPDAAHRARADSLMVDWFTDHLAN